MPKYTSFTPPKAIKLKDKSIDFSTAIVMGILNLTSDSFFDGGKYNNEHAIITQVQLMLDEGATIIDIGAQSSRPGASSISAEEEIRRLEPIIKLLKDSFSNIIISIDTFSAKVAACCVRAGADIINDISAGELDNEMIDTIAKLQVPYIIMHMQGKPDTMQNNPTYSNVSKEILDYFANKIELLQSKGIEQIIIDPGFGFGKTIAHNYQLLNNLDTFQKFGIPVLAGTSRKSMIYKLLEQDPSAAINGTTVTNTIALLNGANILRVHDVKQAQECIKITTFAKK